jgi:cytochrome P450
VPADIDAAGRLTYAAAVANETMRVRPVAPITMLSANRDVVLGDVAAPRGTWIALLTRPPALGGEHFGDPAAFRPERWLDERPVAPHEPGAHMPFGSGPRICPGRTLALLEMRLVLSMLHASFDVARVGEAAGVRERFAFTMHPVGLSVRLQQRADGMPAPLGD